MSQPKLAVLRYHILKTSCALFTLSLRGKAILEGSHSYKNPHTIGTGTRVLNLDIHAL
jgi:hypothetical protein